MNLKVGDIIFDSSRCLNITYAEVLRVESPSCTIKVIKTRNHRDFKVGDIIDFDLYYFLSRYEVVKNPEVVKVLFT